MVNNLNEPSSPSPNGNIRSIQGAAEHVSEVGSKVGSNFNPEPGSSVAAMTTRVYGKWILAGEHAVIRGAPALVFPILAKSLSLSYFDEDHPLSAEFKGEVGGELRLLFWGVFERALEFLGKSRESVRGRVVIESSIPIGAGLGASAALCVGVGRWLAWQGWIPEADLYEFSRQLENLFHGESSGVDIAVALSGKGLHFERNGRRSEVETAWSPHWYLSYSGKRGITSECVARVKQLWDRDAALGKKLDEEMAQAVREAEEALSLSTEQLGFERLAAAINKACLCFSQWGLAGGETALHIARLREAGAVAAKPTGSGDGGYTLGLWRELPPAELLPNLIPIQPTSTL